MLCKPPESRLDQRGVLLAVSTARAREETSVWLPGFFERVVDPHLLADCSTDWRMLPIPREMGHGTLE
jgi:hypothetical protein